MNYNVDVICIYLISTNVSKKRSSNIAKEQKYVQPRNILIRTGNKSNLSIRHITQM